MSEELAKAGLFFDELYSLRVLEPDIATATNDLKDESTEFAEKLQNFRTIAEKFVTLAETNATQVDREKMRAISAHNMLNTISRQREFEREQIQSQIVEKSMILDRLKTEYQYLQRVHRSKQELIENFYLNQ